MVRSHGADATLPDPLDAESVRAALSPRALARVARLDVFTELDSTNAWLLDARAPEPGRLTVCIADFQRAGRGRRGRRWIAPAGACLSMSVGWTLAQPAAELGALPLAIGVLARRAIARLCRIDVGVKWPNDLISGGRKLGGILVELGRDAGERARAGAYAVAGVGVNVAFPAARACTLPEGAADLASATGGRPPRRADLAAALIEELGGALPAYPATGFAAYRAELGDADWLRGRRVVVTEGDGAGPSGIGSSCLEGRACGIDVDGALLVERDDGVRCRVLAGDVTVRAESSAEP